MDIIQEQRMANQGVIHHIAYSMTQIQEVKKCLCNCLKSRDYIKVLKSMKIVPKKSRLHQLAFRCCRNT